MIHRFYHPIIITIIVSIISNSYNVNHISPFNDDQFHHPMIILHHSIIVCLLQNGAAWGICVKGAPAACLSTSAPAVPIGGQVRLRFPQRNMATEFEQLRDVRVKMKNLGVQLSFLLKSHSS